MKYDLPSDNLANYVGKPLHQDSRRKSEPQLAQDSSTPAALDSLGMVESNVTVADAEKENERQSVKSGIHYPDLNGHLEPKVGHGLA